MPNLVVIAGPNGAGKSTAAPRLIGERLGIAEFVNADVIAAGLSGFGPENSAHEAGRIMLRRLDALASASADFAFETTLASRHFARWIAELRLERGYRFHLFFLWLPDAELAVRRVAVRTRHGGHAVPAPVIRRRYDRGLVNFFELYAPIADAWEMHDNSEVPPRLIAARESGSPIRFGSRARWEEIEGRMSAREEERRYAAEAEPTVAGIPVSEVLTLFERSARDAYARHKALGLPIITWRDGRIVEIPPAEIPA